MHTRHRRSGGSEALLGCSTRNQHTLGSGTANRTGGRGTAAIRRVEGSGRRGRPGLGGVILVNLARWGWGSKHHPYQTTSRYR